MSCVALTITICCYLQVLHEIWKKFIYCLTCNDKLLCHYADIWTYSWIRIFTISRYLIFCGVLITKRNKKKILHSCIEILRHHQNICEKALSTSLIKNDFAMNCKNL